MRPAHPDAGPRFGDLFAAEWLKLRGQRTMFLPLLLAPPFAAGLTWPTCSRVQVIGARGRADLDRLGASFNHGIWGVLMIGAGTVGALFLVGEFTSGLIRTTFVAVPDRRRVLLAKAAVLTTVTSAVGVLAAAASFGTAQVVLSGEGLGMSIGSPGAARGFAAAALLLPASALVGLAVGALLRGPVAALGTVFAVSVLLPEFVPADGNPVLAELRGVLPRIAWTTLVDADAGSSARAWSAFALWPVAALLAAAVVLGRRDV
ncbi:ABC transporter permease [Embleya sp. NPDC005971]|uniref:ABC transporter permease n=1 Tax=unclassified Embleya TaxID=2699296 RepID=UPI0033D2B53C